MFEIRQAGVNKGLGIFATHRIARGSRILSERPLLLVDHTETNILGAASRLSRVELDALTSLSVNNTKRLSIWNLVDVLFQTSQLIFLPGSSYRKRSKVFPFTNIRQKRDILACFYNNNFALSVSLLSSPSRVDENRVRPRAVFPTIARLNHSCIPNAQGNFNSNVGGGSFTVHALRDIPVGEEITISYLHDEVALQDERQQWLHQAYGFSCQCQICSSNADGGGGQQALDSNRRRQTLRHELAQAKAKTEACGNEQPDIATQRRLVSLIIETYEQEGLVGGELASLYGVAAALAAVDSSSSMSAAAEAFRLAARSMELERDATGEDSPLYHVRRQAFERMDFEGDNKYLLSSRLAEIGANPKTRTSDNDENALCLSYAPWT